MNFMFARSLIYKYFLVHYLIMFSVPILYKCHLSIWVHDIYYFMLLILFLVGMKAQKYLFIAFHREHHDM